MTTTPEQDPLAAPWAQLGAAPVRKVAWGAPVPSTEAGPAPRVGAPAPFAALAADAAPVAPSDEATPFAALHAGADLGGLFDEPTQPAPVQSFGDVFGAPVAESPAASSGPSEGLGGLFDAPESPAVVVDAPAAGGLSGLFDAPDTGEAQEAPAAGFADVFGSPEPQPQTSAFDALFGDQPSAAADLETGASDSAETEPPVEPEATVEPVSEPTPGPEPVVLVPGPAKAAISFPEPASAAVPAPANPFTVAANPFAAPTGADEEQPAQGRIAAQRRAIDAARSAAPAPRGPSQESLRLAQDARYARAEEFATLVDRLLGLGSNGDPELQSFIRNLELTRDHALDYQQRTAYQHLLEPRMATAGIQIASAEDLSIAFDIAYDEMIGIGPLGPLWRDDSVTEIMVSGPYKVTVERRGELELTPVRFRDLQHLEETARRLGQSSADDRAISSTNPLVTIQLPGARVQFVWRPLAVSKVAITIRKFGALMDMRQLLSFGSLTEEMVAFLADCVKARATVLISGGTGSGKTTFINALSEFIPDTERVITIEDALELQLRNTHVEAFVTKEAASADDTIIFGQDLLLKASLRMRPDRIIVGEIRDTKGCAVMLEAANTGHAGTMTTIHANSPALAVKRMANLLRPMPEEFARQEVGTAIDLVVQVVRSRGRRFVSAISVVGDDGTTTPVFTGEYQAGADAPTFSHVGRFGADTALALKMLEAGLDPSAWER